MRSQATKNEGQKNIRQTEKEMKDIENMKRLETKQNVDQNEHENHSRNHEKQIKLITHHLR